MTPCRQCGDDALTCDACGKPSRFIPQNAAGWRDWHPIPGRLPTRPRAGSGALAPKVDPPDASDFTAEELADLFALLDGPPSPRPRTADERAAIEENDAEWAAYDAQVAAELAVHEAARATEATYGDRWVDAPPPGWEEWRD